MSINSSRVISFALMPFSFSTSLKVGNPLSSVPNGFNTLNPCILLYLAMKSCCESPNACPIWSAPDTVGGGVSNEKISFSVLSESNLYIFLSCQSWISLGSASVKS